MIAESAIVSTCDREPIHLLGAIQPIGFLLSVNADWVVIRASENVQAYLGSPPAKVVGRPVTCFISADLLHDIRGRLQQAGEPGVVEPLFRRQMAAGGPFFAVAVHRAGDELVLEFEETSETPSPSPTAVRGMMARIERHAELPALFREAARQVRALTGFDRVMVYRFADDGHGEVVGEAVRTGTASFMGLRYPASDIPSQARALYVRNLTRIIVDIDHTPVPVGPGLSPEGEPIDLSMSVLRSVSPIHIEYLRNMAVRSSMSISLLQNGKLWGLIACHHAQPKHLNLETRLVGELFGQMLSYVIEVRERDADAAYDAQAQEIHNRVASAFVDPETALRNVPSFLAELSEYVACDGIGIFHAGEINLIGLTPTPEEFQPLLKFLNKTKSARVFATDELARAYPPATDYPMRAAGLLSIPISRTPRDYLVFFRRDRVQTIIWAGKPDKEVAASGPSGVRLTPRKSFEAWCETVTGKSEPWRKREIRAAETLRLTLIEAVLRLSELSSADRLRAQHRQEILIAELNHRVRNLLGLVRGLIGQAAAVATDLPSLVDALENRILSMARAYDLLILGSWQSGSLHSLLRAEMETYGEIGTAQLALHGRDVRLEPKAFAAMAMVMHEVVTNARKYGALKLPTGRVIVVTGLDSVDNVTIAWRETGGPIVAVPSRRGFGSMILERIIPFEVHGVSTPRYPATGFQLDLVLPAAVASLEDAGPLPAQLSGQDTPETTQAAPPANRLHDLLQTCLLVEDNLFISVDVEDLLQKLGAKIVIVARSVNEALSFMTDQKFSFALLDVNLGSETSMPIARALQAAGVPFIFGTGYGETVTLPDTMDGVQIVAKPYHRGKIEKAMLSFVAPGSQDTSAPSPYAPD